MRVVTVILLSGLIAGFLMSCSTGRRSASKSDPTGAFLTLWLPSAPAVVYKTKGDYIDLVPVIMNDDRTRIISWPDPSDLISQGKLMKPFKLKDGYLLDNRGINENVAFLNISYEEYSKLDSPPHIVELMLRIRDRYPLTVMYRCGLRSDYTDLVYELNVLIERGLTNCEKADIVPMSVAAD